jgi:FkbH-like protein
MTSLAEIEDIVASTDTSDLSSVNVTVLRNITVETFEPYLKYHCLTSGFNVQLKLGGYDQILQEVVSERNDLLNTDTDYILVFANLESLSSSLSHRYCSLSTQEAETEVEEIANYAQSVVDGIRKKTRGAILWFGIETPAYPAFGIWESQRDEGQLKTIRNLNQMLKNILRSAESAYFIDMDLCIKRVGENRFYDRRYWHIGRAPYSREALDAVAAEANKYICALAGKNRKCLVLDCDNTLWGGVVAEDGVSGVKLGHEYPGSAYLEFQYEILNLHNRGVILALCSKNNEDDVWEMFRRHPDMVLTEEHIAASRINWEDKASNIRQLADELNIGLDSIVFVDDSEFEIGLVQKEIPEVASICLPSDRSVEYRDMLRSRGYFDSLTFSEEDKNRGQMYKSEARRKRGLNGATDIISYYRSLDMVATVSFVDALIVPRIAQQTQRTNQFNLTTKKYTEDDIKRFLSDPEHDLLCIRYADRFGDSGIVGTCILRYDGKAVHIDSFLVSCRALGRGVEIVLLVAAIQLANSKGYDRVLGHYRRTKKNAQTEHFFAENGASLVASSQESSDYIFELDPGVISVRMPDYFSEIKLLVKEDGSSHEG